MNRTHNNGELRITHVGDNVELIGWVAKKRNLGALVFIDLRDRYGITQIIFDESFEERLKDVKNEYILSVKGTVIERSSKNPKIPTGEIEVQAKEFTIVNTAKLTPMIVADETDALEETRMQYRYLDLRRPVMQQNIMTRHKITRSIREYLDGLDFIDIETPYLNRSTPEGARDFLVPSRVHKGEFYALPQSPQLFKQLLMVSGFEKYYQIARCFRDEDLRADRQIEFTQVDVEMSFMSTDQILEIGEGMIAKLMRDVKGIDIELLKALAEDQNFKYELLPLGFQASMEALDNEEVDAIFSGMSISEARKEIDDVIFVEYNIANGLKVKMPLGEEDYSECAVMVKKGKNKEFIEVINRGLSNLKKNGKYEEIINKYLN